MTGLEKLIQKILDNRTRITIDDCTRLLGYYGYKLRKGGGSHRTFHKKGAFPITIPVPKNRKYIVTLYINEIIKYLKLEEKYGDFRKT